MIFSATSIQWTAKEVKRRHSEWRAPLLAALSFAFAGTTGLQAATVPVSNLNNAGPGSLRQAINFANTNPGPDTITFSMPGAPPYKIGLLSPLPIITEPVVIDGTTHPMFTGMPIIELDGATAGAAARGLHIRAGASIVRGLVIYRFFGGGIWLENAGGNVLEGNFIGTDGTGTVGIGNSGNFANVTINSCANNLIGGTGSNSRNLISGNSFAGIEITGAGSFSNRVEGNLIGTDVNGNVPLNNNGVGVGIRNGAFNNRVGGASAAARNVISGHPQAGVAVAGPAPGNLIQGNHIGTDASGKTPVPNGVGIDFSGNVSNATIGGAAGGAGNVIAFNETGIALRSGVGVGNAILGNSIFANASPVGEMGIDLNFDGPTLNDAGDGDGGPNLLQNFPDLTAASSSAAATMVQGVLSSQPGGTYRLEFFASGQCDPTGFGEGERFLGTGSVVTDAAGNAAFDFSFPLSVPSGSVITASATDANNNTSEFSMCVPVQPFQPPPDVGVTVSVSPAGGTRVGSNLVYTATVTGTEEPVTTGVRLTNFLASTVTFKSVNSSVGACGHADGVVFCDLGDFPPDVMPVVTIEVTANVAGPISNTTTVTGTGPDSDLSNNSAVVDTTAYEPGPPFITQQPQSQTVPAGATIVLQVSGAPPPLMYQWRRNGVNLPGETNDTLVLMNVKADDGASYSAVVANEFDAINSQPAAISIDTPFLPFTDDFNNATVLSDQAGLGSGNNFGATKQPGEPPHYGKPGGSSVWIRWVAGEGGVATFTLAGSTFDTLLAVYTGPAIDALTEVASDEDAGAFHNSRVSFNTVPGEIYHIAIDGFNAAEGLIVLEWNLEVTTGRLPNILAHPESQAVPIGQPVQLAVNATLPSMGKPQYQWTFNGQPIQGATSEVLNIPSVNLPGVGVYIARIFSVSHVAESRPAHVQINQGPATEPVLARGKFRDAVEDVPGGGQGGLLRALKRADRRTKTVAHGFSGTQIFNTFGSTTEPGEPNHCGVIGGASYWFTYQAPTNGLLSVNTEGSSFDTVLAIYTGPGDDFSTLVSVACDNNSGSDGQDSKTSFTATAETIYWIVVDGVGGVTGTVKLSWNLVQPPQIVTQPANQTVVSGNNASFTVSAGGTTPLAYQWRFNGSNIANETNTSLTIAAASPGNEGSYTVVVTNLAGSVTSVVATLTVLVPPAITTQPSSVTVTNGNNAAFNVTATGTAPLKYQWRFNGGNLLNETNSALTVTGTSPGNEGSYTVVITNAAGAITSAVATLTVLVPAAITVQPASLTVTNGSGASFSVTATGTAPLRYQWRFNGSNLSDETNSSLTISSAAPANEGSYTVVVTNSAGSITSAVATLTVLVPPTITVPPSSLTVTNGNNATFNVTATGTAPLKYQWRFNGSNLSNETNSTLTITGASSGNEGNYSVVVTNLAGSITSVVATLTVLVPPAITGQPASLTVTNGSGASFSVTATGTAPLRYQWRFNSSNLSNETNSSLTISSAAPANEGSYTVVVTNSAGSVTSAVATLTVLVPPTITVPPSSLTVTNGNNATFNVTASGTAPLRYQWRFNGLNLSNETNSSLTIAAAAPANEGNYSVVVTNLAGSITSAVATLTVLVPPTITTQPASQTVTNGSTVTFSASANGTPPLAYQWYFNATSIAGANSASLVLTNVQTTNSGNYTVTVSNSAGVVTSAVAVLVVLAPLELRDPATNASGFQFTVVCSANVNFTVQASTNFTNWQSLLTTNSATGIYIFTDTNSPGFLHRFYRALHEL